MKELAWLPEYSVGVRRLDEQHRQLISMINLLLTSEDATVGSETVSEVLTRLTRYAEEHFATEEELLRDHGYPDLDAQLEEHRAYKLKVVALCRGAVAELETVPDELILFMRNWWIHHILDIDMRYRPFLESRGVI